MKLIKAFPDVNIRTFGRTLPGNPILASDRFLLYGSGRAAIHCAAKSLVQNTAPTAFLPTYHCGVEVEAFLRAGVAVRYYRLDDRLNVDLDALSQLDAKKGDVFLVTHYYGFPQALDRIRSFCVAAGLILIEDCAHALYSRLGQRLLGTFGDLAIFSLRKTIALPNGGGILLNSPTLPPPARGRKCSDLAFGRDLVRSVLEHEVARGTVASLPARWILASYHHLAHQATSDTADETPPLPQLWYYDDNRLPYSSGISALSRRLLHPMSVDDIVARRRRHYQALATYLRDTTGIRPVFPELPDGVSPLCLPVWVHSNDRWVAALRQQRVEVFVFGRHHHPTLPEDDAALAERLGTGILGLPVHQDLADSDVQDVAGRVVAVGEP